MLVECRSHNGFYIRNFFKFFILLLLSTDKIPLPFQPFSFRSHSLFSYNPRIREHPPSRHTIANANSQPAWHMTGFTNRTRRTACPSSCVPHSLNDSPLRATIAARNTRSFTAIPAAAVPGAHHERNNAWNTQSLYKYNTTQNAILATRLKKPNFLGRTSF